ncbi:MAG: methyltransferase domain-containing protein [Treponema sp.]|jgi:2-polyprenyl-3-methyl-5-hydroxy-6-metoxy-1,4-benzoquinol methylase/spore coat polysaccharide biosynthesis predicted glycosyltransferase SpsG|nr:methyltransferase domain-containing protein [Treponema sp.]
MTGILVVPASGPGKGGGHLVRSVALVRELRSLGKNVRLFIPSEDIREREKELAPLIAEAPSNSIIDKEEELRRPWDWIILDRFRTSRKELDRWAALGPLIGIDEGGPARDGFDFLLDILPGLPNRSPANRSAPALIPLPKTRRKEPVSFNPLPLPFKILVSFGAEDPEGLTLPICRVLSEEGRSEEGPDQRDAASPVLVTAVLGAGRLKPHTLPGGFAEKSVLPPVGENVRFQEAFPNLKEALASYDLVITHFGLTAFEALHAGTPVLLLSPTPYHEKLARHAGFVSAGICQKGVKRLSRYVYRPRQNGKSAEGSGDLLNRPALEAIAARSASVAAKYGLDTPASLSLGGLLAGFIPRLTPVCPAVCPVCGKERRQDHPVLARFPERTYRRCPRCGMVYMLRLSPPPIEYAEDYFFDFYRRQYGKTYLEDFPNLKQAGKIRLRRIRRLLSSSIIIHKTTDKDGNGKKNKTGPRLLDIGCAYGPFLAAAKEGGFSPLGIDPAEAAVRYVRDRFKIPALAGFFPDPSRREFQDGAFDAVTLWYAIEHLGDVAGALREISRLLRPGGVLAFSTPSISGVSGRKSLKRFLEKSPGDHVTLWDPRRLKKALAPYGFSVKKIVVTGHHPERFPLIGKRLGEKRGPGYRIVDGISRVLGLGDTFEAYAVKDGGGKNSSP